jgi:signal transduction histidine kinase
MTLRTRLALTSLLVAIPAAAAVSAAVASWQQRDLETILVATMRAHLNGEALDRCLAQPAWFFTGPQPNRPSRDAPPPGENELPPRPRPTEQGFEIYPYDDELLGSSPVSPRMPDDLRRALRHTSGMGRGTFDTPDGPGAQVAMWTRLERTPCAAMLGRLRPPPGRSTARLIFFVSLVGAFALIAYLASAETVWRTGRLAGRVEASAREGHPSIIPDPKKDDIGTIGFAYNDAVRAIQLRTIDIRDRDDALRRYAESTREGVASPLAALEARLASLQSGSGRREDLVAALLELHRIRTRVAMLDASARLRGKGEPPAREPVDLVDAIGRALAQARTVADVAAVQVSVTTPSSPVHVTGDAALLESAIGALLDNAIRFSGVGGQVRVTLERRDDGRSVAFSVANTGAGVSELELKSLSAIRRFRGDEDRRAEVGVPGLGLAVAREVAERAGLAMTLRRPPSGGFEVEWTGPASA